MGIDIKINIDFTARQKKIVRAAVVTGAVVAALGVGIAIAAPIDVTWIGNGKPVSAASLGANISELNRRTIATSNGVSYSVGATVYCGSTAAAQSGAFTFTGALPGYPAGVDRNVTAV
jgi:hypothetical protein